MTDHIIARVEDLQSALDLYIEQTKIPAMTIDAVRLSILKEFEENDKKRGVPYLAHTPKVSDTVRIEYKDSVEFGQDEEPFVIGMYSDDFLDGGLGSVPVDVDDSVPFIDQAEYDSLVESGNFDEPISGVEARYSPEDDEPVSGVEARYSEDDDEGEYSDEDDEDEYSDDESDEDDYSDDDEEDDDYDEDDDNDEDTREISPSDFLSSIRAKETLPAQVERPLEAPKKPEVVQQRVEPKKLVQSVQPPQRQKPVDVRQAKEPKSTKDVFDEFDSMFSGVSKASPTTGVKREPVKRIRPTQVVTEAQTVRELVKNNPGCTVEFAKQYFPEREIKKQISVGRIYYKNGKLTI